MDNAPLEMHQKPQVLIVGGSLSGLTLALAFAMRGIATCVLDQASGWERDGTALGMDRALLLRVIGVPADARPGEIGFPVVTEHRQAVSWKALHGWLRTLAGRKPQISFLDECRVVDVVQDVTSATVITAQGHRIDAPIVVGADGYRSVVRRAINPDQSEPPYAGYLLWRALIQETDLSASTAWPRTNEGDALTNEAGYRLVVYPVAGQGGSLVPGERLVSITWYDKTWDALLRKAGCLSPDGHVLSSLPPQGIPESARRELKDIAARIWPKPWSTVIARALDAKKMFATPVAEYFPTRLHHARLAIIGDAAHVVSPATGMGFVAGTQDAEALADSLSNSFDQSVDGASGALENYGRQRLRAAQQLATSSMEWSRAYLEGAAIKTRVKHRRYFLK